jgi:hypothetical protein
MQITPLLFSNAKFYFINLVALNVITVFPLAIQSYFLTKKKYLVTHLFVTAYIQVFHYIRCVLTNPKTRIPCFWDLKRVK